jgi:hypothetical protein
MDGGEMSELYFSTNLGNDTILCLSTLSDRKALAAGPDLETPLGYYLYEMPRSDDGDRISILARVTSEDAALWLRTLLGME